MRSFVASVAFRFDEKYYDWLWGIRTVGCIPGERLGLGEESLGYCATPYSVLRRIFRSLPPAVLDGTFLDYGCGMGRAVITACRKGFRRAIGVESSERLCGIVRRNCLGLPVEIVQCDAALFTVPTEVSVFFFFNPFQGSILSHVLGRIEDSLVERDRPIVIVSYMRILGGGR